MKRHSLVSLFFMAAVALLDSQPMLAQHFVPAPNAEYLGFVGVTPDNSHLVWRNTGAFGIIDVESGESVFEYDYGRGVFEPHGLSDDGRWLIGGGFGAHPFSDGARAMLSQYGLYYTPLKSYLDGTFKEDTRVIDLSPFLPFKESPRLVAFFRKVIDLGEDRFAVIMMIRHEHKQTSKRTGHAIVFSAREHRVLSSCNLDGDGKRISDDTSQHFARLKTIPPKRGSQSSLVLQHVPTSSEAALQESKPKQIAPAIFLADDGDTFLATGPTGSFIGHTASGKATRITGANHLPYRSGPLDGVRWMFSPDAKRAVGYNTESQLEGKTRHFSSLPVKQATIFNTTTGSSLQTIHFASAPPTVHHVQCVLGFSQDNRYLITSVGDWVRTDGRKGIRFPRMKGFALWDLDAETNSGDYQ